MFEMIGLTVGQLAFVMGGGFLGLVWHFLAKLIEFREMDHTITFRSYFGDHMPETMAAVIATVIGVSGLLQLGVENLWRLFFEAAILGYTIDSHVNKWRSRSDTV